MSTVTGNLTLYPRVNSLVVNAAAFDDLSDQQQETLRAAAAGTRDWALRATPRDADGAQQFCRVERGRVVVASDADIAAFERAAQPVYDELERDAATAALLERIRQLKEVSPPTAPVTHCEPGGELAPPVDGDKSETAAFPEGIYRVEITEADLRSYFPEITGEELAINRGTWTWTLADGRYSLEQRAPGYTDTEQGHYEVAGDRITFYLSFANDLPLTLVWGLDGETLTLDVEGDTHPILNATFTAHPWTKID